MFKLWPLWMGFGIWFIASFPAAGIEYKAFTPTEQQYLIKNLKSKQFSEAWVRQFLSNPAVRKIPDMVSLNVTAQPPLKASQYAHFAQEPALGRARAFYERWQGPIDAAAQAYQLEPQVILAILLVETNLGTYTGKYPLVAIYPSVFVDSAQLLDSGKIKPGHKLYNKVKRKKGWARDQILALFKMARDHKLAVHDLKGSYAGAIGFCQFLPTSYLRYAVSTRNQAPDLFYAPDAIHSVAKYLRGHGYRRQASMKKKRKAVYGYNHSNVYVDAVMNIVRNLKLESSKQAVKTSYEP